MLNPKAPGCWGYVINCDPADVFCQECVWLKSCSAQAKSTLLKMHKEMNVDDLLAKHDIEAKPVCKGTLERKGVGRKKVKKHKLNDVQVELVASLPKKSADVVEQLIKKGIDLKVELNSQINPFIEHRPKFLITPCRLLLGGGFTRRSLQAGYMRDFPAWSDATNKSHIGIAVNVLRALEVVEEHEGYFRTKQ